MKTAFDLIEIRFEHRGEDLDPLVYIDGEYRGSLDQLFVDEILQECNGKLVRFV